MPATIDQRTQRVLIELAEDKDLTARERLDAIGKLLEAKAHRPKRTQPSKAKKTSSLLGE